jgi:2-octaprenyl-6-methoxyphenol hydroxylase
MRPALECLEGLGLDSRFGGKAAPIATMRIVDGTRRLIRSPVATFRSGEIGLEAFGMNIPNAVLNLALGEAARNSRGIRHMESLVAQWKPRYPAVGARLADGTEIVASLAVGADGRESPAREAAGISVRTRRLPQAAFVTTIGHERGHDGISTEFHTETGPFTLVPLPGNRSSIVWVLRPGEAEALLGLEAEVLARRIEERMQSLLGKVDIDGPRQVYPLSSGIPSAFGARRIALVGEAAHVFPPIGAQGLNLGIRDAQDLASVAAAHREDPGAEGALRAYNRARRPDILARAGAVTMLNETLLSSFLPLQVLRGAGLGLLAGLAPVRGFFMREGMQPGSGFAAFRRGPE